MYLLKIKFLEDRLFLLDIDVAYIFMLCESAISKTVSTRCNRKTDTHDTRVTRNDHTINFGDTEISDIVYIILFKKLLAEY